MINRRGFIVGTATAALAASSTSLEAKGNAQERKPYEGIGTASFVVGEPCLQAPAETTMGVSWSVSGLSKGVVEIADNPEMKNSTIVRSGGFGLVPIDVSSINVRLENLKPGTKYWYRTITTPFTDYKNIYDAKLGESVIGKVYSFATLGANANTHFAVMNDTHAQWNVFQLLAKKMKAVKPGMILWNGDATNTTQEKSVAVKIFLDPPIEDKDYSAEIPVAFVSGNHDFRGSWISKKEEVVMPRHPAERTGAEWDLKWNFAVRMGDAALIGMDTGEDKPDGHPKWFGLANFEPYRRAQAKWLESALQRDDIASAKVKIVFCHIPLYLPQSSPDYHRDGVKIDPNDWACWSRECHDLWDPLFKKYGVKLVVCAHLHVYRYDAPTADRPWAQIVGGGCSLNRHFPTIIEGKIENDKLKIIVHDIKTETIHAVHEFQI